MSCQLLLSTTEQVFWAVQLMGANSDLVTWIKLSFLSTAFAFLDKPRNWGISIQKHGHFMPFQRWRLECTPFGQWKVLQISCERMAWASSPTKVMTPGATTLLSLEGSEPQEWPRNIKKRRIIYSCTNMLLIYFGQSSSNVWVLNIFWMLWLKEGLALLAGYVSFACQPGFFLSWPRNDPLLLNF